MGSLNWFNLFPSTVTFLALTSRSKEKPALLESRLANSDALLLALLNVIVQMSQDFSADTSGLFTSL
jgi:hypothetical protein